MDTEKIFKTKTGYCHITQDNIILTRDGIIGNVAKVTMGNNIARPLIIYGLISFGFLLLALKGLKEGQTPIAILFLILGLILIFAIIKSFNNSATPIISRHSIQGIEFKKSIPGATRSYFTVHFKNDKGQTKQRLILLPGSLSNGQSETEKAIEIMTSEFRDIKNAS